MQNCSEFFYFKMLQLNELLFCSEVSHFSYKNTVLLIQLKKFKWLLLQEKFTASPGNMKSGPVPTISGSLRTAYLLPGGRVF